MIGRKITGILFSLILGFVTASVFAENISIGGADNWYGAYTSNTLRKPGFKGFNDIVLRNSEYKSVSGAQNRTDMIIHFNDKNATIDSTGNYSILTSVPISAKNAFTGEGAGLFQYGNKMELTPINADALFAPGADWSGFSIEFALYPASLSESESIFEWKGLRKWGNKIVPQEISCRVKSRRLVWEFRNFFRSPEDKELRSFRLVGNPILPRKWQRHMVRFNADTALLEYLIDGIPADVIHTTSSGEEDVDLHSPMVGRQTENRVVLGDGFTGFIDEVRISASFVDNPIITQYENEGVVISRIIDLKYFDTDIHSIDVEGTTPDNSAIYSYYAISNNKADLMAFRDNETTRANNFSNLKWVRFTDKSSLSRVKGRFLLIKNILCPDPGSKTPPRLSGITVNYTPQYPPTPPTGLIAEVVDGDIVLSWRKTGSGDIGGFKIFFGDRPGEYYGHPAIDVGNRMEYRISAKEYGLKERKLYYFTVVAYSNSQPVEMSQFAREIAVRP